VEQSTACREKRESSWRREGVKLAMQSGKGMCVSVECRLVTSNFPGHRRSLDPFEDQEIIAYLENPGYRKTVSSRVTHNQCLLLGVTIYFELSENPALTKIEDLRGAS
jgi:hypothetical protein